MSNCFQFFWPQRNDFTRIDWTSLQLFDRKSNRGYSALEDEEDVMTNHTASTIFGSDQCRNKVAIPAVFDFRANPLSKCKSYRLHPHYTQIHDQPLLSSTYANHIDPMRPICHFELTGGCKNESCEMQHERDYLVSHYDALYELMSYDKSLKTRFRVSRNQSNSEYEKYAREFVDQYHEKHQNVWDASAKQHVDDNISNTATKKAKKLSDIYVDDFKQCHKVLSKAFGNKSFPFVTFPPQIMKMLQQEAPSEIYESLMKLYKKNYILSNASKSAKSPTKSPLSNPEGNSIQLDTGDDPSSTISDFIPLPDSDDELFEDLVSVSNQDPQNGSSIQVMA